MNHYVVTLTETRRFSAENWKVAKTYINSKSFDSPSKTTREREMVEEETGRKETFDG